MMNLETLIPTVRATGLFADVAVVGGRLLARAKEVEAEAYYYLEPEDAKLWVGLCTPDRWLSESIEADLMHTGDHLEELLAEELVDLGIDYPAAALKVEHFRDDRKRYTFRVAFPLPTEAARAVDLLRAMEATFRNLGDLAAKE